MIYRMRLVGLVRQELRDRSILVDASHSFDILADAIEIRLGSMSSSPLMARVCHVLLRLKDDRPAVSVTTPTPPSTFAVLNLKWSQLHVMITRSITSDVLQMITKLTEFIDKQIRHTNEFLASIQHDLSDGVKATKKIPAIKTSAEKSKQDANIVKRHIGMNGGEIILQGQNLTLAVFHGLNFKSRQWALFSLNQIQINFVTDLGEASESRSRQPTNESTFPFFASQSKSILLLGPAAAGKSKHSG